MARQRRRPADSGIHHVMNRGVDRQAVFFDDHDRMEFGRRLAELHESFGVETLAYCLMDNHYHLLLRAADGGLSKAMHHLGTTYTVRTNQRHGRDGPLFRGRFHSIPVETDTYLAWSAGYIHRNPLDLPGVRHPAGYRWSSYRTYLGRRPRPEFLNTHLLLGMFGYDRQRLAVFTEQASQLDLSTGGSLADLDQLLRFEIARDDVLCGSGSASSAWRSRTVLLLLMDRFSDLPLATAIESRLAFSDASTRARAIARARAREECDPAVARILAAMAGHVDLRPAA